MQCETGKRACCTCTFEANVYSKVWKAAGGRVPGNTVNIRAKKDRLNIRYLYTYKVFVCFHSLYGEKESFGKESDW